MRNELLSDTEIITTTCRVSFTPCSCIFLSDTKPIDGIRHSFVYNVILDMHRNNNQIQTTSSESILCIIHPYKKTNVVVIEKHTK